MIKTEITSFNSLDLTVKNTANDSQIIKYIRTCVFVKEQSVDATIDFDGRDDGAKHVLVYYQAAAVGTARMLDDGHIGRVAILKDFRKKGIGLAAMQALLTEAKLHGLKRVYLASQVHASVFYEKMGFQVCSEEFMGAGIIHVEMELYL